MHGGFDHVGEEVLAIEEAGAGIDGLECSGGDEGGAVVLDLNDFEGIPDGGWLGEGEGDGVFKEAGASFGVFDGEEGEVCLVVDGDEFGFAVFRSIGEFEFEVGGVCDHFRGGEDLIRGDDCGEGAQLGGRVFFPWLGGVPGLAGGVYTDDGEADGSFGGACRLLWLCGGGFSSFGGCGFVFLGWFRSFPAGEEEEGEEKDGEEFHWEGREKGERDLL